MINEIQAVKNTIGSIRHAQTQTDEALAEIQTLGELCNAEATALYRKYKNDVITYVDYNTQLDAVIEYQKEEGDHIERRHAERTR
jgi:hypothetical protein